MTIVPTAETRGASVSGLYGVSHSRRRCRPISSGTAYDVALSTSLVLLVARKEARSRPCRGVNAIGQVFSNRGVVLSSQLLALLSTYTRFVDTNHDAEYLRHGPEMLPVLRRLERRQQETAIHPVTVGSDSSPRPW